MSLDQRKDEDLAQIMTPAEIKLYRWWEKREENSVEVTYTARLTMRKLRAKARARHKRKNRGES